MDGKNPEAHPSTLNPVSWLLLAVLAASPSVPGVPDAGTSIRKPVRTLAQVKLLYFHASWCTSCSRFDASEVLSRLKAGLPGLTIEQVDVDTHEPLLTRYGVTVTPTLVLVDADGFPLGKPSIALDDPDGTLARLEKHVRKMASP